LTFHISRE